MNKKLPNMAQKGPLCWPNLGLQALFILLATFLRHYGSFVF